MSLPDLHAIDLEPGAGCYFAGHLPEIECDPTWIMRCHVIAQKVIKREHQLANPRSPRFDFEPSVLTGSDLRALLDDPRNWRPGCWAHHQHVDGPWGSYPVPESAREFASEYGLERFLPSPQPREAVGQ